MGFFRAKTKLSRRFSWVDFLLLAGVFLLLYGLIGVAEQFAAPFRPKSDIRLDFVHLVQYSLLSLTRVVAAYFLSLIFTFVYGYFAAKSRVGEAVLIPLLDILQSIPVLGFMPGLVLALIRIFPHSNFGLEIAAIVMIFTGEGWNMVFSFYSSIKGVPQELREVTRSFGMRQIDILRKVEIPYATNGLLWNSMLSMAGGWFFLMVIESFSLGDQDFRLPGIGSYMAVAYEQGDTGAAVSGIAAMFFLIFLVDRCVWAPLVVWSERFKYERESTRSVSGSVVLDLLNRSNLLPWVLEQKDELIKALEKRIEKNRAKPKKSRPAQLNQRKWLVPVRVILILMGIVGLLWGGKSMYGLLGAMSAGQWLLHFRDILLTFLRVTVAVVVGSLWTIPVGVFIGTHPQWTRRLQPVVQIVASFPAPMVFPILTFLFSAAGISIEYGAVILMIFASQWYILFNVLSGATRIPLHLMEVGHVFRVKGWRLWKSIILPSIFPSLVNGWITAAGGAWNASIVAEFIPQNGGALRATGIGASITQAAKDGNFPELAAGILVMVTVVVLLNRFFWGSLYRLAETRYRLEA